MIKKKISYCVCLSNIERVTLWLQCCEIKLTCFNRSQEAAEHNLWLLT